VGFELIKAVVILLALLGGLYLLLRFLKGRIMPGKGIIEMVHYQSFGPKKGVAIVKIVKDYVALGIADENITLLGKLSPADVEEALKQAEPKTVMPVSGIRGLFGGKFKGIFSILFIIALTALFLIPSISFAQSVPAAAAPSFFGLSSPVELLLFLTIIAFLPALSGHDDLLYQDRNRTLFFAAGTRHPAGTADPGDHRAVALHHLFRDVARIRQHIQ